MQPVVSTLVRLGKIGAFFPMLPFQGWFFTPPFQYNEGGEWVIQKRHEGRYSWDPQHSLHICFSSPNKERDFKTVYAGKTAVFWGFRCLLYERGWRQDGKTFTCDLSHCLRKFETLVDEMDILEWSAVPAVLDKHLFANIRLQFLSWDAGVI